MTQAERDEHRRMITGCKEAKGYLGGVLTCDEALALLDGADRCEVLEKRIGGVIVDLEARAASPGFQKNAVVSRALLLYWANKLGIG